MISKTNTNLAERLRDRRRILLTIPLLKKKLASKEPLINSSNIEVQLTGSETCNLHCWYCSTRRWGAGSNQTQNYFEKNNLQRLKLFNPKVIILSGGEPTLYHPEKKFGFNEAILEIAKYLPTVKFGLITNGTIYPEGKWIKLCQWLRISLDAGTRSTYKKLKGVDLFDSTIANFHRYLSTDVPFVGIGFVYQKENIDEIYPLLKIIYSSVRKVDRKRVSVQFRPIIYYPKHLPSKMQIDKLKDLLSEEQNLEFVEFCQANTNITQLFSKKEKKLLPSFKYCYLCRVHKAITSDGDIYPCCLVFKNKECCLGNLSRNSKQEIANNEREFFYKSPCKSTCRLNQKNEFLENNLNSNPKIKTTDFICPHFF